MEKKDVKESRKYLLELLHEQELTVEFTKKDGSTRKMKCTLMADKLPERVIVEGAEEKPKKAPNLEIIKVWDLEKKAWRSFRVETVTGFTLSI